MELLLFLNKYCDHFNSPLLSKKVLTLTHSMNPEYNNSQVWASGLCYLSYTFFMLTGVVPAEWSNKRQWTTYGHFSVQKCVYGNVYEYVEKCLMKVNVSAHIWQVLLSHPHVVFSFLLCKERSYLLRLLFSMDGFLHS